MKVKIQGNISSRGMVNLFGRRVQLWRRSWNIDESTTVFEGDSVRVRLPGPFDAVLQLSANGEAAVAVVVNGFSVEVLRFPLPYSSYVVGIPVRHSWNGNRIDLTVRFIGPEYPESNDRS